MHAQLLDKPIRVGIFDAVQQADQAINGLLDIGFTKDNITVVCSDEQKEHHFPEFEHQHPAGQLTAVAVICGALIGCMLGGIAALVSAAMLGVAIVTAAIILVPAGAVIGGFVGAMMTQANEKELANYYDQAVVDGKILVAAEDHSDQSSRMLAQAEQVLAIAGAKPIELSDG